jgi:hypothetical protein
MYWLVDWHVRNEKEIFEIASAVASTMFGIVDGAVEMQLGVGYTDSRRAKILVSIKPVTANSHADATWFGFAWAHSANKVGVGNFATIGNLVGRNEEDSVLLPTTLSDGA